MAKHPRDAAQESCPACDFGPFLRNDYWTGKLMLAGDFIAEQRYFLERLRHHNQRLHGWGVVCGLKVVAHAKCPERFICVEPGSAVDCCGHDLLVQVPDGLDLDQVPEIKALKDKGDTGKHRLQVCIRYRECETEPVPVLYDECGCDQDRCAPNRILDSYELGLLVDVPAPVPAPSPGTTPTCSELWGTGVAGCPTCDHPDCLILATIEDYVVGDRILDPPTPPATLPGGAVAIDNDSDRRILPSVQLLKSVIDCMLQQAPGGGTQGQPGKGIDAVSASFIDCKATPADPRIDETSGKRTLVLEIPKGCDGDKGADGVGLEKGLTRIQALSWHHGSGTPVHPQRDTLLDIITTDGMRRPGFVIGFTAPVQLSSIDADHVFQVWIESDMDSNDRLGLRCRCPLVGEVVPVKATLDAAGTLITAAELIAGQADASQPRAVAFLFPRDLPAPLKRLLDSNKQRREFWILMRCDFVLDAHGRAVDGEFVRHALPTGARPASPDPAADYGSQGGTFESWCQIQG